MSETDSHPQQPPKLYNVTSPDNLWSFGRLYKVLRSRRWLLSSLALCMLLLGLVVAFAPGNADEKDPRLDEFEDDFIELGTIRDMGDELTSPPSTGQTDSLPTQRASSAAKHAMFLNPEDHLPRVTRANEPTDASVVPTVQFHQHAQRPRGAWLTGAIEVDEEAAGRLPAANAARRRVGIFPSQR